MEENTLIKIEISDRYNRGDIGFINDFNMGYVQKYIEVMGKDKEAYILRQEEQRRAFWEADLAQCFSKYKESLKQASKYIDTTKYKLIP